jgi:protein TonB
LNRLGRFLSAAQQAQVDEETHAAPVVVEVPEEIAETPEDAPEVTSIDADVIARADDGDRRRRPWAWVVGVAVIAGGAVGLFMFLDPGQDTTVPPVEASRPAPVVESIATESAPEESTILRAGVSPLPTVPAPVVEPVTEPTADDDPAPAPAKAAESLAVVPVRTEDPAPTPAVEATIVEDGPPAVSEDPPPAPIQSESIPPPEEADPFAALEDVDVQPRARQRDLPRYTRRARRLQQEGVVQLQIRIDSHGDVAEVLLLSGIPDSDLNQAAVEVARDWRFSPARKDGQHVQVWKEVAFEFAIRPDRTTSVRIRE